jgi:hypothetical protein
MQLALRDSDTSEYVFNTFRRGISRKIRTAEASLEQLTVLFKTNSR